MATLKYLDVIAVVVGAVPALLLGAPAVGYLIGAGGWLLQRLVRTLDRRYTARLREPRTQVGINVFESFGRIWLLAGAIVVAAVAGDRQDGLTAAIVILVAYSIAFAIRLLSGPPPAREPVR